MNDRQQKALDMLRANPRCDLYEGQGRGFFISYSGGHGPELTHAEVRELVDQKLIRLKWPQHPEAQFYVLTR